ICPSLFAANPQFAIRNPKFKALFALCSLPFARPQFAIRNSLVDRIIPPTYHRTMSQQVIIEEHEMTPEMARLFEQGRRNLFWFSENAERLEVFKRYRGRHMAAAGGELFVADTPEEARRL